MDPVESAELALSVSEIDPNQPSPARIYDFWLGGSQNFAVDRQVGERAAESMPTLVAAIRANRAFLGRAVHHLVAELGITQFLDLGSGVPTVGNVHEVAQRVNPSSTVVYVDSDPVAIAHARALLADNPGAKAILADLRRPDSVMGHPLLADVLDMGKPVAVLMNAVLHFIADDEDPGGIVRTYLADTAPGSYVAISHAAPDPDHPAEQEKMLADYRKSTGVPFTNRPAEVVAGWLDGLEIQPPGIVPIDQWRPDPNNEPVPMLLTNGVLARKP
jgi:SAM-dependent methyltransferase